MSTAESVTGKGILFDVDGTLVDSNYLHAVTWHEALRVKDRVVPMAVIHRGVGMGADKLLDHLLGEQRDRDDDDAISTAHKTLYREHWEQLTPLPRAAELLRACAEAGLVVVLASSADEAELGALRAAVDADDAIASSTNADDVDHTKPDPDLLEVALSRGGLAPADVVFVGDSVWDGHAAAKLSIPFVALTCGGTSAAELTDAGAHEVWADPGELLDHLDERLPVWFGEP
jgi:HAD superfamily hydrolase (TIGR01509 family)